MSCYVGGVRDVLTVDYTNASRDQAWVGQDAQAHCCVESFAHKIDRAIAVGNMRMQKWMPPRELGENRVNVSGFMTMGLLSARARAGQPPVRSLPARCRVRPSFERHVRER
jgi:hypothetical protein